MLHLVTEPQRSLRWENFGERTIYTSSWVELVIASVKAPNGARFDHHVVRLHRVAVALVVNQNEQILTLWRHRFATDQWGYELVGGLVEEGEEPAQTAAREVTEETGYQVVGEPEHIASFQPLPGMVDSQIDAFLWRQVEKVGEPTDSEEAARIEWIPVDRMLELVQRGEVLGAGAIVPLLLYLLMRRSG